MMVTLLLLLYCCLVANAFKGVYQHVPLENCNNRTSTIQLDYLKLSPSRITFPGGIHLGFRLRLTSNVPKQMDDLELQMTMWKMTDNVPKRIPCYNQVFGSCTYWNPCYMLDIMRVDYDYDYCPRSIKKRGLPCQCPFNRGKYKARNLYLRVPKFRGLAAKIMQGRFRIEALFRESSSLLTLGCYRIELTFEKRSKTKSNKRHNQSLIRRRQRRRKWHRLRRRFTHVAEQ